MPIEARGSRSPRCNQCLSKEAPAMVLSSFWRPRVVLLSLCLEGGVASTAARCTMLDANHCRAGLARAASGQHAVAVRAQLACVRPGDDQPVSDACRGGVTVSLRGESPRRAGSPPGARRSGPRRVSDRAGPGAISRSGRAARPFPPWPACPRPGRGSMPTSCPLSRPDHTRTHAECRTRYAATKDARWS